ncbi:MAG: hypothetical protein ABIQ95_01740 [Bdellovibrionia bacterium]
MYLLAILLCTIASSTLVQANNVNTGALPKDWYLLPEEASLNGESIPDSDPKAEENLETLVENLFKSNQNTLEKLPLNESQIGTGPEQFSIERPKDWTPWHMEYITTDLAITLQGLIGILTIRATPGIQTFWRRQDPPPAPHPPEDSSTPERPTLSSRNRDINQSREAQVVELSDETNLQDITRQIEPVIQAAKASGKIKNIDALRENLRNTAEDLEALLQSIDSHPNSEWWPSTFRFEFFADAEGKVHPIVYAGGELRFRFEWRRIQRKKRQTRHVKLNSNGLSKFKIGLQEFVDSMEKVLADASVASPATEGFVPCQFRVGIGTVGEGTIGLAKGSAIVIGNIFFSRDISKPVAHPQIRAPMIGSEDQSMLIIESFENATENATRSHLHFAKQIGLPYSISTPSRANTYKQVAYQVGLNKVMKGVKKTLKIGRFFAKQGAKANSGKWKIHNLFVDFDLSITGNFAVVSAGGVASAQVNFYNKNFWYQKSEN